MANIATGAVVRTVRNNGYSGTENNGGNGTLVVIVEAGLSGTSPTVTATWNGVSMSKTIERGIGTNAGVIIFTLASPATGSNTLTVAGFTSIRQRVWFVPTDNTGAVRNSNGAITASGTSLSAAVTTVAGDLVLGGLALRVATDPTVVASGDAVEVSEGQIISTDVQSWGWESSFTANDTSADMGASWTGAVVGALAAVSLENAAAAPTINTQPQAATAQVAGPNVTATFTIAATTSGGSLTYDWELETSVGGGVYANLADGNGATWTGQAAASCTGTFTATTLTGRRVRCNVTDSNGTTTSTAVTLTVKAGTTITSPTTNGSGIGAAVLTSDVVNGTGSCKLVTVTHNGATIRTTARKTA